MHVSEFFTHIPCPKTYTYTVCNAERKVVHVEIKAKGVSLSSEALEVVTSKGMDALAAERDRDRILKVPQFQVSSHILAFLQQLIISISDFSRSPEESLVHASLFQSLPLL